MARKYVKKRRLSTSQAVKQIRKWAEYDEQTFAKIEMLAKEYDVLLSNRKEFTLSSAVKKEDRVYDFINRYTQEYGSVTAHKNKIREDWRNAREQVRADLESIGYDGDIDAHVSELIGSNTREYMDKFKSYSDKVGDLFDNFQSKTARGAYDLSLTMSLSDALTFLDNFMEDPENADARLEDVSDIVAKRKEKKMSIVNLPRGE